MLEKTAHFQRNIHKTEGSLPLKRKKKVATQYKHRKRQNACNYKHIPTSPDFIKLQRRKLSFQYSQNLSNNFSKEKDVTFSD